MERQQIKQVDLIRMAEEQGVKLGKSHMSQYVSGKTVPRAELLRFLADALNVEEAWLSGKEEAAGKEPTAQPEQPTTPTTEPEPIKNRQTGGITMREFKKSSKLDNVLYDVRGPVVDEASRMEEDRKSVV